MELIDLKELIKERLENLSDINIYDGPPGNDGVYPYVIYSFPNPGTNNIRATRTDRIMELDFWDDTNDDTNLLDYAAEIKNGNETHPGLNNSTQDEAQGFYKCYIEGDTWEVPEPDNDITHLKQTYVLHIG